MMICPAELFDIVPPNVIPALPPVTLNEVPEAALIAPVPSGTLPATLVRVTLFVPPVEVTEVNPPPATVPVVKLRPAPVVFTVTSFTVTVPNPEPSMANPLELLPVKPFKVFVPPRVTPLPAAF